ncbi:hypothetical protein [uncultured Clostridium sp.]|uniref:hypothetical protein n=1 Tax=uncultured Clostridium sp. TaxID=59620 RepID=UPI0025F16D30|nr:hypothetical protein [uncultured Clostridium sp.]
MKVYEEKLLHKLKVYRKIDFYVCNHRWILRIDISYMDRTDLGLRNDIGEFLYFFVDGIDVEKETIKKIILTRIKESKK